MQLLALLITLAVSSVGGLVCGFLLSLRSLCDPLDDHSLFDDELFFNLPNAYSSEEEEDDDYEESNPDPTIIRVKGLIEKSLQT